MLVYFNCVSQSSLTNSALVFEISHCQMWSLSLEFLQPLDLRGVYLLVSALPLLRQRFKVELRP